MSQAENIAQEAALPQPDRERPPEKSWRYFISMIRYSLWVYLAIVVLRLFIFTIFPQVTGLLMREFFNTLSGDSQLGVTPQAIAVILVGLAVARR